MDETRPTPPADPHCLEMRGHLPLYVGGDLDQPDAQRVAEHLPGCVACSAELDRSRRARGALLSLGIRVDPEVDAWTGVRSVLAAEGRLAVADVPALAARARRKSSGARGRWALSALAAALAIALGIGLFGGGDAFDPDAAPIAGTSPGAASDSTLADGGGAIPAAADSPAGALRRARPDEERLWYQAKPFGEGERGVEGQRGWSLAGDRRLR